MRANASHIPRSLAPLLRNAKPELGSPSIRSFRTQCTKTPYTGLSSQRNLHISSKHHDKPTITNTSSPLSKPPSHTHINTSAGIAASHLEALTKTLQTAKTTTHETLKVTDVPAPHTGYIRIVSLDRPKARNAISKAMLRELGEQVEGIHAEEGKGGVRVLVLASEVDEVFCAGADLKERREMGEDEVHTFLKTLRGTLTRLSHLPIPSITSISGTALGGGLELSLCTSLRLLSSNALLALPETRLGIIPGAGGTYRLPALVGRAAALDMILTGRRVGAVEAAGMGLGRYVGDGAGMEGEERLDPESKRLVALSASLGVARQIAQGGPLAIRAVMRAMGEEGPGEVAENVAYDSLIGTRDRVEALVAFAEKREPRFMGE